MRRVWRARAVLFASGYALAFALMSSLFLCAGCRAERDPGTLVVGLEGAPTTLDPRFAADAYATRILPLLFESLVAIGPDGGVRPGLAETWSVEDGVRYVFTLRARARFSDGASLTAEDAAANIRYVMDPANGCPAAASFEAVKAVEAPGDRTLVIELSRPFAPFLLKLARGIIPTTRLADKDFGAAPVGSGPYVVESHDRGRSIALARNGRYAGPAPAIERIRFEILANETTRLLSMKNGDIDLLQNNVPPYALQYFAKEPGLAVERTPGINYSYLGFNLEDPRRIVSRVEVRRAIAHAIDRERLIRALLLGQARPADSLLAPENWAHTDDVPRYDYNPAKAKALLDQTGFSDPDGDGPMPRFTLSYKTSTDRLRNRIADVIAAQLAEVGVGLEKRSYEWGTFFSDIKSGNFQTFSLTWVGVTDPDHLFYVFHSSSLPPSGANRGRYRNPQVDAWLEQARLTQEEDERKALYAEIERAVADDVVYVGLWWMDNLVVRSKRFAGFVPYPGGEYTSLATARWVAAPGADTP